jgi:peptidoglycan/xylan/chitin deacetylase (PgdA/CDA1 family)
MKQDLLKTGLKALYYSRTHRLLEPFSKGLGMIFMLHQVTPEKAPDFSPNAILKVEPRFLDGVIAQVKAFGLDIVDLDEAHRRLLAGYSGKRFVCFTLDDGYRDNLEHALPVFQKHDAPFTVYVPSDYPEGQGELWWLALERTVADNEKVEASLDRGIEKFDTSNTELKQVAFNRIYWWLREIDEEQQRAFVRDLCQRYGIDQQAMCRDLIMNWDEIREIARHPLATIGAHTVAHFAVAKLSRESAKREMVLGSENLSKQLGQRPLHFSYPYGDAGSAGSRDFELAREAGFKTAVTTRKGVLFPEHAEHLTALPRVSLNGAYQSLMYTELYLSGAPFALWNRFRRVNAA